MHVMKGTIRRKFQATEGIDNLSIDEILRVVIPGEFEAGTAQRRFLEAIEKAGWDVSSAEVLEVKEEEEEEELISVTILSSRLSPEETEDGS